MKRENPKQPYRPVWDDPRVQARLAEVLPLVVAVFQRPRRMRSTPVDSKIPKDQRELAISDIFGSHSGDLAPYLLRKLLHKGTNYVAGKKSIMYTLKPEGVEELQALLKVEAVFVDPDQEKIDRLSKRFAVEISSGHFLMNHSSFRNYHTLLTLPGYFKERFWKQNGYAFNFDIRSCAPSIFLYLAQSMTSDDRPSGGLNSLVARPILDYIENKAPVAARIIDVLGLPTNKDGEDEAKEMVNAMFMGAPLSLSYKTHFYRKYGKTKVEKLKADKMVWMLYKAITFMWRYIRKRMRIDEPVVLRTTTEKNELYRRMEEIVQLIFRQYLALRGIRCFPEHDGFITDKNIDLSDLERVIEKETTTERFPGMKLTIKSGWKIYPAQEAVCYKQPSII